MQCQAMVLKRSVLPSTAVCIFAPVHLKTSPCIHPRAEWILLGHSSTVLQVQHQQEYGPEYFFMTQVRPKILFTEGTVT